MKLALVVLAEFDDRALGSVIHRPPIFETVTGLMEMTVCSQIGHHKCFVALTGWSMVTRWPMSSGLPRLIPIPVAKQCVS